MFIIFWWTTLSWNCYIAELFPLIAIYQLCVYSAKQKLKIFQRSPPGTNIEKDLILDPMRKIWNLLRKPDYMNLVLCSFRGNYTVSTFFPRLIQLSLLQEDKNINLKKMKRKMKRKWKGILILLVYVDYLQKMFNA